MTDWHAPIPPLAQQINEFNRIALINDDEMRYVGIDAILQDRGYNACVGLLAVGRSSEYSTLNATVNLDLDPFASRLGVYHEVGLLISTPKMFSFDGLSFAWAYEGEEPQPAEGSPFSFPQLAVMEAAVLRLRRARSKNPFITKSLLRVNPAGD